MEKRYIVIITIFPVIVILALVFMSCKQPTEQKVIEEQTGIENEEIIESADKEQEKLTEIVADVISVEVTGENGDYHFNVGIQSPDEGCHQYADWWEVLTEDGQLIYRRILAHSHVGEQPFERSGGPVLINEDAMVIVRAHMDPTGYGGKAMKGTIRSGFNEIEIDSGFAPGVEKEEPQPGDCAF